MSNGYHPWLRVENGPISANNTKVTHFGSFTYI
jgi:hypothetical protein